MTKPSPDGSFDGLVPGRVVRVSFPTYHIERPASVVKADRTTGIITENVQFDASEDVGRVKLPSNHRVTGPVETVTDIPHASQAAPTACSWDWPLR